MTEAFFTFLPFYLFVAVIALLFLFFAGSLIYMGYMERHSENYLKYIEAKDKTATTAGPSCWERRSSAA